MKKRLISLICVTAMVITTLMIPVSVSAADFSTGSNFEDYTGEWNGADNFKAVLPKFPNVTQTKSNPYALDAYSGVTNGTAGDNKYGNSLKIFQKPNQNAASNVYTMVHFDQEMTGSMYMEVSMYVEKSATGKYSGKSIRINSDGGVLYPVTLTETQKISVFSTGTNVEWVPEEWYDVKVWYNFDSGAYKVQIANDGNTIVDTFGLTTAGKRMTRFIFYMIHHCKHAPLIAAGEQVTYYDNFKLENTDKVMIDEMASLTHFTFDEWDDEKGLPGTLGKGEWKKGLSGNGVHPIIPVETDRGTSAWVRPIDTDDINSVTGNKYDYNNPALFFNHGTKITSTLAMKTSFMLPYDNFGTFNVKLANGITAVTATHGSTIYGMDYRDTGLETKLNTWYDLEVILDFDTGYYYYYLTDGTFEYVDKGFSQEAINLTENYLYRTWFRMAARIEGRYNEPSGFIIDDFYYGPITKISAPLYGTESGSATLNLPFRNTTFRYTADVDVRDLSKDTILTANGTRVISKVTTEFNYDLVKIGSDGKVYIGETAIADASTGEYSVEAVVDQAKFNAAVKVSKDGAVIGTGNVALGDAALLMKKMSWNVADTAMGNVEYRGIYEFALDTTKSSNGTIKASEAVVARFSNALDRASFNADSVKVNDGAITPEITFIDDNTAVFDFAKAPGGTYTIKMNGVCDLFGNTTSDYIRVTLDNESDIYLTDVSFTKGGNAVDVTEPGEIYATISAAAYGGDKDISYTLALYEGGRMVDCDFENFTATKTLTEKSLKVNIPDDGKHYVLKAYVNDAETLEPYTKPAILTATNLPVIILKLDGIGVGGRLTGFESSYEYAVENNIKMNFGVIARDLDSSNEADIARLYEMEKHDMIEFWNHQYGAGNMSTRTREEVFEDFENAKRVSEKTGIEYVTFNSIENYIHSDIADALNAYNYKAVLSRADEARLAYYGYLDKDNTYVTLWRTFDVEKGATGTLEDGSTAKSVTVCLPVEDMLGDWDTAKLQEWPYAVLQYHPVNWPKSDLTDANGKVYSSDYMFDFIEYLEAEGVIFMTSTEYVDYASVIQ